jgi:flavin reductase (DIM6/NTAB) family NADH-FMN oxidoreductase RutF
MRVFPQGVTVVTAMEGKQPRGITVSAFTSISLAPPLILVSISKDSSVYQALTVSKSFAVNFLSEDQASVSDRFAGRDGVADRFEGIEYATGVTGAPLIKGSRAIVECKVWKVHDGGDHSLLLGEVLRAQKLTSKPPLVFYVHQYTTTKYVDHSLPPAEHMW